MVPNPVPRVFWVEIRTSMQVTVNEIGTRPVFLCFYNSLYRYLILNFWDYGCWYGDH
jgi:hypothetical protein